MRPGAPSARAIRHPVSAYAFRAQRIDAGFRGHCFCFQAFTGRGSRGLRGAVGPARGRARRTSLPTALGGISHSERSATPSVGSQSSNRLPGTRLPTLRVDRPASPILDRSLAGVLSGRVTRGRTRLTPRCSEACRPAAHLAASPSGRRARPPKAGARSAVFGDHQQTIAGWAARGAQELGQRAGLRINAPSGGMRRRIE